MQVWCWPSPESDLPFFSGAREITTLTAWSTEQCRALGVVIRATPEAQDLNTLPMLEDPQGRKRAYLLPPWETMWG